jgi:hypothetical protein
MTGTDSVNTIKNRFNRLELKRLSAQSQNIDHQECYKAYTC